ncbi:hypothetical protein CPB83DRAFT_849904 [Crepidotus variabilis]|uniref:DUF7907 domain-containing protein n=1 Tax=Crepidotus variabilis TaxID=179855 RepID=A0A9P6EKU4_9AGAR|nr:hypothetical protein CPB83DRAFT_849904 [Crepidotus variabilis]
MSTALETTQSPHKFFYLKATSSGKYANRYVRYTGSGHADVVLTEAHPVFLKFYLQDDKQLAAFKERVFGFVMGALVDVNDKDEGLRAVEMFEDKGDGGFYFDEEDAGKLKWKGVTDNDDVHWKGWVLKENPEDKYKGNPQLFWTTVEPDVEFKLENGMERVELIREYL